MLRHLIQQPHLQQHRLKIRHLNRQSHHRQHLLKIRHLIQQLHHRQYLLRSHHFLHHHYLLKGRHLIQQPHLEQYLIITFSLHQPRNFLFFSWRREEGSWHVQKSYSVALRDYRRNSRRGYEDFGVWTCSSSSIFLGMTHQEVSCDNLSTFTTCYS